MCSVGSLIMCFALGTAFAAVFAVPRVGTVGPCAMASIYCISISLHASHYQHGKETEQQFNHTDVVYKISAGLQNVCVCTAGSVIMCFALGTAFPAACSRCRTPIVSLCKYRLIVVCIGHANPNSNVDDAFVMCQILASILSPSH